MFALRNANQLQSFEREAQLLSIDVLFIEREYTDRALQLLQAREVGGGYSSTLFLGSFICCFLQQFPVTLLVLVREPHQQPSRYSMRSPALS